MATIGLQSEWPHLPFVQRVERPGQALYVPASRGISFAQTSNAPSNQAAFFLFKCRIISIGVGDSTKALNLWGKEYKGLTERYFLWYNLNNSTLIQSKKGSGNRGKNSSVLHCSDTVDRKSLLFPGNGGWHHRFGIRSAIFYSAHSARDVCRRS